MKKVRVGVIGCGNFANDQHFPNCSKNERVEITWACSRNEERRKRAAEKFDIKNLTPDAREVFEAKDVDVVILSIPHDLHEEMVTQAAAAGKHILCEKPMAMTMDEAYRIVRAVRKAGVKLCVDYNRRFSPSIVEMKRAYHEHRAAPATNPRQLVFAPGRQPLPEEDATMMMIRINDDSATYRPVHLDWSSGGGQIIGEGCHWLDLATWMLEDEPVRVYAAGWTRLSYCITVDYRSGARLCLLFACCGSFEYPKELIEIMDHGALFRNECFVETQFVMPSGLEKKTYPMQFDDCPEAGVQGGLSGYVEKLARRGEVYEQSGKKEWRGLAPDKGHYDLLDAFVTAVLEDGPSPVDEVAGAKATYLCRRAMDSIRRGTPMPVNQEDYDFFVW